MRILCHVSFFWGIAAAAAVVVVHSLVFLLEKKTPEANLCQAALQVVLLPWTSRASRRVMSNDLLHAQGSPWTRGRRLVVRFFRRMSCVIHSLPGGGEVTGGE